MSVLQRVKAALDVYKYGYPNRKGLPWGWASHRQLQPQWHLTNYQTYVNEGFNLNSLVYAVIMYKVRATITAPLRAYRGDPNYPEPLAPTAPLSKLVAWPNRYQNWAEFQALNYVYLNIDGNAYWYETFGPKGRELWPLRPDRVFIVPTAGRKAQISHYLYVPEGKSWQDGYPMLVEDVSHVKLPNPGDPLEGMGYGLSPLSAIARSVDVDNLATTFLNVFFNKGTMLAGLLIYDMPLTEDVVDVILERWEKKYGGTGKWGAVGVLDRDAKYQRLGLTIEEMGFGELDERSEARICSVFGISPILVGTRVGLKHSPYSNLEGVRKMAWEDTLLSELMLFQAEYQKKLKAPGAFVKFDLSGVPALMKDVPVLAKSAFTLVQMGVPPNQALRAVGLHIGDVPNGDVPREITGRGQGQGSRADDEDDSWGMRSLECDDCGGSLKFVVGMKDLLECPFCRQAFVVSTNGRGIREKDRLLQTGL